MLAILLGVAFVAITIYYYFVRPVNYWKERGVPYKKPTWIFGENYRNTMGLEPLVMTVNDLYKKTSNKRYYGFFQFTKPTLLINDPELIKKVTVKDFEHFTDHRTFVSQEVDPLWGKNLFELKGDRWKHMRPVVTPSFTSSKMKFLFELISDCAEKFVESFSETEQQVIEYDVGDAMSRYSSDIIASAAFGVAVDSSRNSKNEFYQMAREASDFSQTRLKVALVASLILPVPVIKALAACIGGLNVFLEIIAYETCLKHENGIFFSRHSPIDIKNPVFIWTCEQKKAVLGLKVFNDKVSKFFQGVVDETVKIRKEKGIVRPDLIHMLLDAQKTTKNGRAVQNEDITNADILAHSMNFLVGGLETMTRLLTFISYELALNKPIQDKLRNEIVEARNKTDGRISYESILRMKYLDMVISETLRKYPVMSAIDRICTKSYVLEPTEHDEKPLLIEKGVSLWIPILSLHHDPKHFENPDVFNPERFSDENKDKINPYIYIPFGVGPRICIGARFSLLVARALVCHLLSNFELFPTEKTQVPMEYCKDVMFLVPDKNVFLGLRRMKT